MKILFGGSKRGRRRYCRNWMNGSDGFSPRWKRVRLGVVA
jgi:hypothetical protein